MRNVVFILSLLIFCSFPVLAQQAEILWSRPWNGGDDFLNMGNAIDQTSDGGFIVFGEQLNADNTSGLLLKIDSTGYEEWFQLIGEGDRKFVSGQQTSDGGYICAGSSLNLELTEFDAWLVKTDSNGNEEWSSTFTSDSGSAIGKHVEQTSDGGYALLMTGSINLDSDNLLLIKLDSNGNEEWNQGFAIEACYDDCAMRYTSDGGFILSASWGETNTDLIKIDSGGNLEWHRTFNDLIFGADVIETSDGGCAMLGLNVNGYTILKKTNENGIEEWNQTFGGNYRLWGHCLEQTNDSGFIIGGYDARPTSTFFNYDAWILKTDLNGNEEWSEIFVREEEENFEDITLTADGCFAFAGYSSADNDQRDAWIVRYATGISPTTFSLISPANNALVDSTTFNLSWETSVSLNPDETVEYDIFINCSSISIDTTTIIENLGETNIQLCLEELTGFPGLYEMVEVNWYVRARAGEDTTHCRREFSFQIEPLSSIKRDPFSQKPDEFKINSVYPNPFNSSTTISIELPVSSDLKVGIYNITGQEVAVLANRKFESGFQQFSYNAEGLSSGVYFVRASMGTQASLIKKIVYVR